MRMYMHKHACIHVHRRSGTVKNMTQAAQPHGKPAGLPVQTQNSDNRHLLPSVLYTYKATEDATRSLTQPGLLHQSSWKIESAPRSPGLLGLARLDRRAQCGEEHCSWVVSSEVTFSGC